MLLIIVMMSLLLKVVLFLTDKGGGEFNKKAEGGEIAQSLASLSTKRAIQVRAHLDPLVIEGRNSITVLLTCSHQCRRQVKKGRPCVIMSV